LQLLLIFLSNISAKNPSLARISQFRILYSLTENQQEHAPIPSYLVLIKEQQQKAATEGKR